MKMELLAASHFCEELYDAFGSGEIFRKILVNIPLIRFEFMPPMLTLKDEPFTDSKSIDIFKCFANKIMGLLDQ